MKACPVVEEQYLGFLQSRRLCFLYCLQGDSSLELFEQGNTKATHQAAWAWTLLVPP